MREIIIIRCGVLLCDVLCVCSERVVREIIIIRWCFLCDVCVCV